MTISSACFAPMPNAQNDQGTILFKNRIACHITALTEADDCLPNEGRFRSHAKRRHGLDQLQLLPDCRHRTARGVRIFCFQKFAKALCVRNRFGCKDDPPILRGVGAGLSLSVPQLRTQAFTSSKGTTSAFCSNARNRRKSSSISGSSASKDSSSSSASEITRDFSCPRRSARLFSCVSASPSRSSVTRALAITWNISQTRAARQ